MIVFPGPEDRARIATGFYEMITKRYPNSKGFPRVIGAVDGTQINIFGQGAPSRENWRNRHGNIAMNVQAICDHELIFTNVVVRWQRSVHDSRIFRNCSLQGPCERGEIDGWLLGDSGYFLTSYMLTPLANPVTSAERLTSLPTFRQVTRWKRPSVC